MSSGAALTGVIRHLQANDPAPDSELLTRYARHRDEAAFAAVVERYGGLVLGVARRQLAGPNADDVFQATFLALARSADRLHEHTPLANWLYTVALRQARKARARECRRAAVEQSLPPRPQPGDPLDAISGRDLLRLIDEELGRLPEKYRLPVLLCCVQGLSREDAASRLGVSGMRLKGRLERGRRRLADRLASRGLTPAALVLGTAVVPAELHARTASLAANPWAKSIAPDVVSLVGTGGVRGWALAAAVALVPFALAGWAIGVTPKERETTSPATALADPVPPSGATRFGSTLFRHGTEISSLAVSADGKRAVASSGQHWLGSTRGYDLTSGRELFTVSEEFRHAESVALSPDGKLVAVKQWKKIGLFDAETGKHVRTIDHGPTPNGISTTSPWLTFSPDGKTIAFIAGHGDNAGKELTLVNVETGNVTAKLMAGHMVYGVSFSPDGKRLVGGGHDNDKGKYFARMWDIESGTELRKLPHGQESLRTIAYSPDGKTIAGAGDNGWLRIWDADTGKELHSLPQPTRRNYSVAFSPDGKTLAVAGGDKIRLIDTATTQVKRTIDRHALGLRFDAEGKVLTGAVAGAIHRWDAATGDPLTPQDGSDSAIDQIAVTPDGRRVLTQDQSSEMHLWDASTGKHLRRWAGGYQRGFALSPDGKFVVWRVEDEKVQFTRPDRGRSIFTGCRLRLYDLAEGRSIDRFPGFKGDAHDIAFTPDGKSVLTVDSHFGNATLWDVEGGKELRSFPLTRPDEKARDHFVNRGVLSPDGKTLAVTYNRADNRSSLYAGVVARLWDVATGKELHELTGHMNRIDGVAFSPDGKLVVTCSEGGTGGCSVWETATGKRAAWVTDPPGVANVSAVAVAFSRDGRTLATASGDGTVQLWEVATWAKRAEFKPHRDRVSAMTFAPDGRLLTGGLDTTTVVTSVRPPQPRTPRPDVWDDLSRADAVSFAAQGQLLADPAKAVSLLSDKLKPTAPPDAKELAALVADLDSPDFATREAASKRLREVGRIATAALREGAKSESPETRKRAGELLAALEKTTIAPEELRVVRAVEVLEWIGTPDARKLLAGLAAGAADARLTTEAKAALGRLSKP